MTVTRRLLLPVYCAVVVAVCVVSWWRAYQAGFVGEWYQPPTVIFIAAAPSIIGASSVIFHLVRGSYRGSILGAITLCLFGMGWMMVIGGIWDAPLDGTLNEALFLGGWMIVAGIPCGIVRCFNSLDEIFDGRKERHGVDILLALLAFYHAAVIAWGFSQAEVMM